MKRILRILWANKQAITGTVTASISALATAGMLTADLAVKITTVTGVVTAGMALVYTLLTTPDTQPPA